MLDESPVGKILFEENNLYAWFRDVYSKEKDLELRQELIDRDAKAVMTPISALFARAAFGDVKTAVCGANRERVFYETEIPHLLDKPDLLGPPTNLVRELMLNKEIETINCVPAAVLRAVYRRDGIEAAYQRICLTELRERFLYARSAGAANVYADYIDRLEVHRINQYEHIFKAMPPDGLPDIYRALLRPDEERIAARNAQIASFAAAMLEVTGRAKGFALSPPRRVASPLGFKYPLL